MPPPMPTSTASTPTMMIAVHGVFVSELSKVTGAGAGAIVVVASDVNDVDAVGDVVAVLASSELAVVGSVDVMAAVVTVSTVSPLGASRSVNGTAGESE